MCHRCVLPCKLFSPAFHNITVLVQARHDFPVTLEELQACSLDKAASEGGHDGSSWHSLADFRSAIESYQASRGGPSTPVNLREASQFLYKGASENVFHSHVESKTLTALGIPMKPQEWVSGEDKQLLQAAGAEGAALLSIF